MTTDSEGERFFTRTDSRQVTAAQFGTALFVLVASVAMLVNLVWITFADDRGERLIWIIGMGLSAAAAGWFLWRLRRWQYNELTIDGGGITFTGHPESRSWKWSEIQALAIVRGRNRLLAIEDDRTRQVQQRLPRSDAFHQALTNVAPLALMVNLDYLEADEADIVDAVRRWSAGRFPDPERGGVRIPPSLRVRRRGSGTRR